MPTEPMTDEELRKWAEAELAAYNEGTVLAILRAVLSLLDRVKELEKENAGLVAVHIRALEMLDEHPDIKIWGSPADTLENLLNDRRYARRLAASDRARGTGKAYPRPSD